MPSKESKKSKHVTFRSSHLLFVLKHSRNPESLDECDIDEKTKEVLLENIKRRLTPQSVKIRAGRYITLVYIGHIVVLHFLIVLFRSSLNLFAVFF